MRTSATTDMQIDALRPTRLSLKADNERKELLTEKVWKNCNKKTIIKGNDASGLMKKISIVSDIQIKEYKRIAILLCDLWMELQKDKTKQTKESVTKSEKL